MTRASRTLFWLGLVWTCLFVSPVAGAQVNGLTPDSRLLHAAEQGKLKSVKAEIAAGANVNAVDAEGYSALELAGLRGRLDELNYKDSVNRLNIIKLLLEHDALLPRGDKYKPSDIYHEGFTRLILARTLYFRRYDVTQSLIQHGASSEIVVLWTVMRSYPLGRRPDPGQRKLFEQALAASDQRNRTNALVFAVYANDAGYFVPRLVETGADLNARGYGGFTPLVYAVILKKKDIAKYLLENGADTSIPFEISKVGYSASNEKYNGMTPLQIAQENHDRSLIAILKKAGTKKQRLQFHPLLVLGTHFRLCASEVVPQAAANVGAACCPGQSRWKISSSSSMASSGRLPSNCSK